MKQSLLLLRRGKPRPRAGMFPDKYRRVPALLKPQQGGQQYFSQFLIRTANEQQQRDDAARQGGESYEGSRRSGSADGSGDAELHYDGEIRPRLPQVDVEKMMSGTTEERIQEEMKALIAQDGFQQQRGFNERVWYEQERERVRQAKGGTVAPTAETDAPASLLPERELGDDYFASRHGYSLLKLDKEHGDEPAMAINYSQLDLWGEMPKYHKDMIFLYLISRRRNTYAVAYDYEGRRLLTTYTAGNRGMKGGDRGFRGDGSSDVGHQVTSMYLNDLLPKIRANRAEAGRPMGKGDKVEVVVRVMGFYNGRQGAVRAVQDRSIDFAVRYLEDITPFPLNGPKMPRGVFK